MNCTSAGDSILNGPGGERSGSGDGILNTSLVTRGHPQLRNRSISDATQTMDEDDMMINLDDFTLSDVLDTSTPEKDDSPFHESIQLAPKRKRVASPNLALLKSKVSPTDVPKDQEFPHVVAKEPVPSTSTSTYNNAANHYYQTPTIPNQNGTEDRLKLDQVGKKLRKPNIILQSKVKETIFRQPQLNPLPKATAKPSHVTKTKTNQTATAKGSATTTSTNVRTGTASFRKGISADPKSVSIVGGRTMKKATESKVQTKADVTGKSLQNGLGGRHEKPKDKIVSKNTTVAPKPSLKKGASTGRVTQTNKDKPKATGIASVPIITHLAPPVPNPTTSESSIPSSTNSASTISSVDLNSKEIENHNPDNTQKPDTYLTPVTSSSKAPNDEEKHLFRSQFWSYIDPKKYPPPKTLESKTPEREKPYDSLEVQSYIEKQRELRKEKEKSEAELKKLQITKKKLQLAELDMKRRQLVAKSKMSPVVPNNKNKPSSTSGIPRLQNPPPRVLFKPPIPHQTQSQTKKPNLKTDKNPSSKVNQPMNNQPNIIPDEEVNENNNVVNKLFPLPSSTSFAVKEQPSPHMDLGFRILLQDFENIVHRECLSVLRRRLEEDEKNAAAKETPRQNFQQVDKAVETTTSLCEDDPVGPIRSTQLTVTKSDIQRKNLAAAKIQAAFRSYKVRKIWREVEESKRRNERRSRKSSFFSLLHRERLSTSTSDTNLKKGPLKACDSEGRTAFGLRLNSPTTSYIPPPPDFNLSLPSTSESSSTFQDLSQLSRTNRLKDEAYPKEAIRKLRNSGPNINDISLNTALRRKSIEGFKLDSLQRRESFNGTSMGKVQMQQGSISRLSEIMAKSIQELHGPVVPTFSTVLKEKIRLLKENNSNLKFKADNKSSTETDYDSDSTQHASIVLNKKKDYELLTDSSSATITDDYIGPGEKEMIKAHKLRTSNRLTFEPVHHRHRPNLPNVKETPTTSKFSNQQSEDKFNSPRSTTTVDTDDDLKSGSSSVDLDDFLSPIRKFQQVAERKRREVLEHALETALAISLGPKHETITKRRQTIAGTSTSQNTFTTSQKSTSYSPEKDQAQVEDDRRKAVEKALKIATALQSKSRFSDEQPSKEFDDNENAAAAADTTNENAEVSGIVDSYTQEFYSEKTELREPLNANSDVQPEQIKKMIPVPDTSYDNSIAREQNEQEVSSQLEQISEIHSASASTFVGVPEEAELSRLSLKSVLDEPVLEDSTTKDSPKLESEKQNDIISADESLASVSLEVTSVQEQIQDEIKSISQMMNVSESIAPGNEILYSVGQLSCVSTEQSYELEEGSSADTDSDILEDVIRSVEQKTSTVLEPISEHYSNSFLSEDHEVIVEADKTQSKSEAALQPSSLAPVDSYSEVFSELEQSETSNQNFSVEKAVEGSEAMESGDEAENSRDKDIVEEMEIYHDDGFEVEPHTISEVDVEKSEQQVSPILESHSQIVEEVEDEIEEAISEVSQIPNPPSQNTIETENIIGENTANEDSAISDDANVQDDLEDANTGLEEAAELELISKKQKQIEEEIRLLQARDTLPEEEKYAEVMEIDEEYAIFPEEEYATSTGIGIVQELQNLNITPPPPYIPEIIKPVTCFMEVAQTFIDIKIDSIWEDWVKSRDYNVREIALNELGFNFDSEEIQNFENAHQGFVTLYNDVLDELLQETLQIMEKPFIEQIRPGLISFQSQKHRIPKSKDELKIILLKQFLETVPKGHLISADGDPISLPPKFSNPIRPISDRVDEILISEAIQEDKQWNNSWPEQLLLKDALSDVLIKRTIRELLQQLKSIGNPLKIPSQ